MYRRASGVDTVETAATYVQFDTSAADFNEQVTVGDATFVILNAFSSPDTQVIGIPVPVIFDNADDGSVPTFDDLDFTLKGDSNLFVCAAGLVDVSIVNSILPIVIGLIKDS